MVFTNFVVRTVVVEVLMGRHLQAELRDLPLYDFRQLGLYCGGALRLYFSAGVLGTVGRLQVLIVGIWSDQHDARKHDEMIGEPTSVTVTVVAGFGS